VEIQDRRVDGYGEFRQIAADGKYRESDDEFRHAQVFGNFNRSVDGRFSAQPEPEKTRE
jgi:hypothetical protein